MAISIAAIAIAALAAWFDLRNGRIPNGLTYSALGLGVIVTVFLPGQSAISALIGLGVGGGLFLVFWLAGGLGAGDVKLMAALGVLLGWPRIWDAVFYTALCGAAMGILFLIWRRIPAVTDEGGGGQVLPRRKQKMPYAVAIAAGTILAAVLGQ